MLNVVNPAKNKIKIEYTANEQLFASVKDMNGALFPSFFQNSPLYFPKDGVVLLPGVNYALNILFCNKYPLQG
ncbi:MAG: hypothetical protein B6D61_03725, partial [Bacteroidetes bacterium 4484_249]